MKICTQCELPLNTAWFRSEPRTNIGLQSVCRMCEALWRDGHNQEPEVKARKAESTKAYDERQRQTNLDPGTRDEDKKCHRCKQVKPASEFALSINRRGGLRADCKDCNNNLVSSNIAELKDQVFALLGDDCKRCSYSDRRALQIDHVNGGGNKEHAVIKNNAKFLRKVISEYDSGEYQILCANCNWVKRYERNENPVGPRLIRPYQERAWA